MNYLSSRKKVILKNNKNSHLLDAQEETIPNMAKDAFYIASIETLESGQSILKVSGNSIYEVLPNGEKIKIKNTKLSIRVKKNSRVTLK